MGKTDNRSPSESGGTQARAGWSEIAGTAERIRMLEQEVVELKRRLIEAPASADDDSEGDERNFLHVKTGDRRLAIPIAHVDEVVQVPKLDALDEESRSVVGMFNYHGRTTAVLDLASILGQARSEVHPDYVMLMCTIGSRKLAIMVEEAIDMLTVTADDIAVTDEVLPGSLRATGVLRLDDKSVPVLDVASIALAAELSNLGGVIVSSGDPPGKSGPPERT